MDSKIEKAYLNQLQFTINGWAEEEGSKAIALGRTAGLAKMYAAEEGRTPYEKANAERTATHMWEELGKLTGKANDNMPDIHALYEGYKKNPDAFSDFGKEPYTASLGLDFSNAAGAYAYGLDALRQTERPNERREDLNPKPIANIAAKVLRAAGLEDHAELFDVIAEDRKTWTRSTDTPQSNEKAR